MSYYGILGLEKEPFSTSPDPAFFFFSRQHKAAFYRLQIGVALRRGLSVLLGDVGTGKTTLSRKLSRALSEDPDVEFHMILNPYFKTDQEFLSRLTALFHIEMRPGASSLDSMDAVERYLFKRGVEESRNVVLLIDEAQMLPDFAFEILRILLNYETNEYKLLQLLLVGQMELLPRISGRANFWDRIALKYVLNPLDEAEVREMIEYRLRQAGYAKPTPLFSDEAVALLWRHTQGYPRKLSVLCHNCLEDLVMHDRSAVDAELVRSLIEAEVHPAVRADGTWTLVEGASGRGPEDLLAVRRG
jgi:general secretion pathway protein A